MLRLKDRRISAIQTLMGRHRQSATEKHVQIAQAVIKNGESYHKAAIDAGLPENAARLGAKAARRRSNGLNEAFLAAAREFSLDRDQAKAAIRYRLLGSITQGEPSKVARECELLGSDKELDMWVRSGDVQIGIFGALGDPNSQVGKPIDSLAAQLPPEVKAAPAPADPTIDRIAAQLLPDQTTEKPKP